MKLFETLNCFLLKIKILFFQHPLPLYKLLMDERYEDPQLIASG